MNVFQAYHKPSGKYLHEKKELFGKWNRKKGLKKFYTRSGDAKGALTTVMSDQTNCTFKPEDWEIHELMLRIIKKESLKK